MQQVTVITTGGTIGSILNGDAFSVDQTESVVKTEIDKVISKRRIKVDLRSAINKNSEDIVPEDWNPILSEIKSALDSGADRIVVTHGTDTLAYTVAAAAAYFNESGARICFTGSFYSPENPDSDAGINLAAAFEAVMSDAIPLGVYASFRSGRRNSSALIIPGLCLKPMGFDDTAFAGVFGELAAKYSYEAGLTLHTFSDDYKFAPLAGAALPSSERLKAARSELGFLHLHPGIDPSGLAAWSSGKRLVVIELYHSGTGPDSDGSPLIAFLRERPESCKVLLASFPSRFIEIPYESTQNLSGLSTGLYKQIPPHVVYMVAFMGIASGLDETEILDKISKFSVNFERV